MRIVNSATYRKYLKLRVIMVVMYWISQFWKLPVHVH